MWYGDNRSQTGRLSLPPWGLRYLLSAGDNRQSKPSTQRRRTHVYLLSVNELKTLAGWNQRRLGARGHSSSIIPHPAVNITLSCLPSTIWLPGIVCMYSQVLYIVLSMPVHRVDRLAALSGARVGLEAGRPTGCPVDAGEEPLSSCRCIPPPTASYPSGRQSEAILCNDRTECGQCPRTREDGEYAPYVSGCRLLSLRCPSPRRPPSHAA